MLTTLTIALLTIHESWGRQQQFLREPTDVTAIAGQQVVLPCTVEDKEGLLQWTKDDFGLGTKRDLPGYPTYSMRGQDPVRDWSLVIESVTLEDDGIFQCQVGSGSESTAIRSALAKLTVLVPPGQPKIAQHGSLEGRTELELEVEEGESLELTCISEGGRPAGEITWRDEEGEQVLTDTDTSTHKLADKSWRTKSKIRLRPSFEDRDKSVFCLVANHVSQRPMQAVARLRLRYKPRVSLTVLDEPAVVEGGDMNLVCQVEAYPPPHTFAWHLDGLVIPGEVGKSLVLEELTRSDIGKEVSCSAANTEGNDEASIVIDVAYAPEIVEEPKTVRARAGEEVTFTCKATGNPEPTYKWTRVGSELSVGDSAVLNLISSNVTMGQYCCHAQAQGFTQDTSAPASLLLVTSPVILSPLVQMAKLGELARLQCRVATVGSNNLISWDRAGIDLTGHQDPGTRLIFNRTETEQMSTLVIERTSEEDFGTYGCKASNEVGVTYASISLKQEGSNFDKNKLLYIMLGGFALATLILMAILCVILYKRRKRSNLKYLRAVKQEKLSRGAKEEAESIPEDLESMEDGQLFDNQPDLLQPMRQMPSPPSNLYADEVEQASDPEEDREPFYYAPQKKPFSIDRFLKSPLPPPMSPPDSFLHPHESASSSMEWKMAAAEKLAGLEAEEEDQFLTLLPASQQPIA